MSSYSAVKSKIASYEAHNNGLRSTSPAGSRKMTNSKSSTSLELESPLKNRESSQGVNASSASKIDGRGSSKDMSTSAASQSRISRIRQQQLVRDGKAHHTTNLMEKRKQIKERRLMQQKRAEAAAAAASSEMDSPINSSGMPYRTSQGKSVDTSNRLHKHPDSAVRPSVLHEKSEIQEIQSQKVRVQVSSPSRNGHSRMSKMQRMQKMKGMNRHQLSQPSSSPVASSGNNINAESSSTSTILSRNGSDRVSRSQRLRKNAATQKVPSTPKKRSEVVPQIQSKASPPTSPIGKNEMTFALNVNESSFSHLPASSPRSSTDVFSESNYTTGQMDNSVEPVTDDEATLTSVRRVMAGSHPNSPGSESQPYQISESQNLSDSRRLTSSGGRIREETLGNAVGSAYKTLNIKQRRGDKLPEEYRRSSPNHADRNKFRDGRHHSDWLGEEKSDKNGVPGGVFRTTSSSDYDTDGDISKTSKTSRQSNNIDGPSQSQATDVNDFFSRSRYSQGNRKMDDDDRTFDYGDRDDDDSNGSASYAARRRKEAERRAREVAVASGMGLQKETVFVDAVDELGGSPLINKDDVEHYKKSLDTPAMRMGVGVAGAATVGIIVLGPVGLLVGAAAVAAGVGVMQIPEEERNSMQAKAHKTLNDLHDKAVDASESLSTSCAASYQDSGVADHLPQCLSGSEAVIKDTEPTRSEMIRKTNKVENSSLVGVPKPLALPGPQKEIGKPSSPQPNNDRLRNKKVACLRNVRILPAGQIHGLDPASQPRAWLDVIASANTSNEEKNEAMEEILILAKDKRRARIFLDEGILDSIIWTLDRYFEKLNGNNTKNEWKHPDITPNEKTAAKLAATCCITLGKAHCAAVHTEGDLLLMSLYERGTVPEERQLAQMLHEVPHHARITKTTDPTVIEPTKEIFALKQLSLPQAEELAQAIKEVADGGVR